MRRPWLWGFGAISSAKGRWPVSGHDPGNFDAASRLPGNAGVHGGAVQRVESRERLLPETLLKLFDLYWQLCESLRVIWIALPKWMYTSRGTRNGCKQPLQGNCLPLLEHGQKLAAPLPNQEKMLGAAAAGSHAAGGEILVQYGMRTKAVERLQRIQELFPRKRSAIRSATVVYDCRVDSELWELGTDCACGLCP